VIFLLTEGIESWRESKEEDKETGVKLKKKSLEFDIINISVLFPIPGITHQFHHSYKSCENRPVRGASNDGTQSYGSPSHLPL
jgi:hypothetical protein